jgi:hypothetical protein
VVATGIGEQAGKPCIRVMVVRKSKDITLRIPVLVDGYPVVIEETGEFQALPAQ